ncbi:excinuclease ABC subunit UvrA [Candidatus Berkelbacteria bacterium]|nr:excinuclease ABC subunit UvrA [Candidatus Berkelbacteria bacterium]
MAKKNSYLVVEGARVHNLQNISVKIPRDKITVITGLSGSGKSSLAFDTIYAEGQRRYVGSLSSYARQFFESLQKPDVDLIEGLAPAISIDQKSTSRSPRSTVATMSEIYDYLRLLFVRIGTPHCPTCDEELEIREKSKSLKPNRVRRGSKKKKTIKEMYCQRCDQIFPELTLSSFSFNNPQGACRSCQGLGTQWSLDPQLVLPNPRLTLAEGAVRPWSRLGNQGNLVEKFLEKMEATTEVSKDEPVGQMSVSDYRVMLYGNGSDFEGILAHLEERYRSTSSSYVRTEIERYMIEKECKDCLGTRLKAEARAVRINGFSITDINSQTILAATDFVLSLVSQLKGEKAEIAKSVLRDISARLSYLKQVGLGYLTLDRGADTLAGGEAQRIRLATQLGSGLTGVLYVLDEPSIGLHPKNLEDLIKTVEELRDLENTVVVVEHDAQMINRADYIIDIGPGAGVNGGQVIAAGTPQEVMADKKSLTAQYLRGDKKISSKTRRRQPKAGSIRVVDANCFNLDNVTVDFPLQTLTCVTGVSGSGKSTLVQQILAKALARQFHQAKAEPGAHKEIIGTEKIDKVISVDQSPIGRTPRSNPATYTNVFGLIRDLFADQPSAKRAKYAAGHFSFNVKGGRCEECRGDGLIKHEMHFMPDVYITCEACQGSRYKKEILDITYKDKTIYDVLRMTIDEAKDFFADLPAISGKLKVLSAVGLGYLELGQPATTLSGGEAQRIKLATDLARQSTGKTLYILDEPTTGLHFHDVKCLLNVLQALVDKGNTVLVIEHNLDVIAQADWVIDMGPGGGDDGGQVVAVGSPEAVAKNKNSATGRYLKQVLKDQQVAKKELVIA